MMMKTGKTIKRRLAQLLVVLFAVTLMSQGTFLSAGAVTVTMQTAKKVGNAISTESFYYLALKADGTFVDWGFDDQISAPPDLTDVVAVSAGNYHAMALKSDGTVVTWGHNDYGQCNVLNHDVIAIAAGYDHSMVLQSDGTVKAWGRISKMTRPYTQKLIS